MGFTPLEGLVMATRTGSVDPGLIVWLLHHGGLSAWTRCPTGWSSPPAWPGSRGCPVVPGICATSAQAADRGNPDAGLALDVYLHRLRAGIAAMAAALGGLDTLVFTGGIGEHQSEARAEAAAGLGFLGVAVDAGPQRRRTAGLRHHRRPAQQCARW